MLFLLLNLVLCLLPLTAYSAVELDIKLIRVSNTSNDLQQYLCGRNDQQIPNNTVLELVSSSYILNASGLCLISDRHRIGFVSKIQSEITCTTKTGLGFVNVNDLNISNVVITGCGAPILPLADKIGSTTGPYLPSTSYATLAIVNSSDVSLSNIGITEYYGYAILAINVYGESMLSDLIIINYNKANIDGSGVMVYYHNSSNHASLTISNANFASNQLFPCSVCLPELLSSLSHNAPVPTPYASVLSVVYNQVSQKISVALYSCIIAENTGYPMLLILYFDSLHHVTTTIDNSLVINNQEALSKCQHGTGLAVVTYFSEKFAMRYEKSHMSFTNDWTALSVSQTNFNAGMFNSERQSVLYLSASQINQLIIHYVFQNVQFQYNSAAEVVYAETISTSDENIKSLAVHFIDVVVDGNVQNRVTKNYWYAPGAILTFVDVAAVYISDSEFTHNDGSVIEAYDTDIYMSGNVSFQYNSGSNGAALLLLGQSYLFIYPNLSADFDYNTYKYGGAIYSFNNKISDDNNSYCTFQVLSSNLSEVTKQGPRLHFADNIANIGKYSVSAISIDKCQQNLIQLANSSLSNLYEAIFLFKNNYINNEHYSDPARILPCVNGKPHHNFSSKFSVYPGEKINISLAAIDGSGGNIATPVQVLLYHGQNHHNLEPSANWSLSDCEKEQILDGSTTCTNISLTIHTKQVNSSCFDSYSTSIAFFSFPDDVPTFQSEILLKPCPPGFELDYNTGICGCNSLIKTMNHNYQLGITCDIQNVVVKVPNLESWIGCYNNSKELRCEVGISPSCFPGLCNYSADQWISGSASICIDTREGALCSSCRHGYSVVFGSNQCQQCSNWWLFTIAIYASAGLLLVASLFAFKLTISAGTLNGLIFFGNMWYSGPLEILSRQDQSVWATASSKFISLLNVGLVYPLCFYDGMTEMKKSWLQLIFPVYLLALVALVVIVSRYSMRVSSLVYSRALPVLVTVVHLSLSGIFVTVSIGYAFSVGYIYTADDSYPAIVWLRDGNVPYFSPEHITLMIVSLILAGVFILPYMILLIGAQWWIKFKIINLYFKPVLDAAHGPYRDNMHYWFSLRLILLLQQMVVYATLRGVQGWILYSVNGPILFAFTILHIGARPFKSNAVNILDGLMMLATCLVVYACSALDDQYSVNVIVLSSLVTAVFIVFIVILSYHILLAILMYHRSKSLSAEKAFRYFSSFIDYDMDTHASYQPINNERQPTPQFREPLLDVSYGSTVDY